VNADEIADEIMVIVGSGEIVRRSRDVSSNRSLLHYLALLIAVAALSGCETRPLLMPTPNLHADAVEDPFAGVPEDRRKSWVEVLYATDRRPDESMPGASLYGYERSLSLAFGACRVDLGAGLSWSELVRLSRTRHRDTEVPISLSWVNELVRFPPTPYRECLEDGKVVPDPRVMARAEACVAQVHRKLQDRLRRCRRKEIFLYVHGFNNSFEDAAVVAAEYWHFLGRVGVPVIFSWPAGSVGPLSYFIDRESGEFAIHHLKMFLRMLGTCPGLEKVNIVAHSRGTDVLTTAIRELHMECGGEPRATREQFRFGRLVLAAPDLDIGVMRQRGAENGVGAVFERSTVYFRGQDRAIKLAEWLFGSDRRLGQLTIGSMTEEERQAISLFPNMEMIEARVPSADLVGHGYFHSSPAVSSDVILILRDNRRPGAEHGRPLIPQGPSLWLLPDGYPDLELPSLSTGKR
jgi:esterase/lipase superfamily enzyme